VYLIIKSTISKHLSFFWFPVYVFMYPSICMIALLKCHDFTEWVYEMHRIFFLPGKYSSIESVYKKLYDWLDEAIHENS
jgi:hypothetical protein